MPDPTRLRKLRPPLGCTSNRLLMHRHIAFGQEVAKVVGSPLAPGPPAAHHDIHTCLIALPRWSCGAGAKNGGPVCSNHG